MSKEWENDETVEEALQRPYTFDKFVQDLERREQLRREALEKLPTDHNEANRLRDARNREHLHNRLRWNR